MPTGVPVVSGQEYGPAAEYSVATNLSVLCVVYDLEVEVKTNLSASACTPDSRIVLYLPILMVAIL